jgi:hypothetical protein
MPPCAGAPAPAGPGRALVAAEPAGAGLPGAGSVSSAPAFVWVGSGPAASVPAASVPAASVPAASVPAASAPAGPGAATARPGPASTSVTSGSRPGVAPSACSSGGRVRNPFFGRAGRNHRPDSPAEGSASVLGVVSVLASSALGVVSVLASSALGVALVLASSVWASASARFARAAASVGSVSVARSPVRGSLSARVVIRVPNPSA